MQRAGGSWLTAARPLLHGMPQLPAGTPSVLPMSDGMIAHGQNVCRMAVEDLGVLTIFLRAPMIANHPAFTPPKAGETSMGNQHGLRTKRSLTLHMFSC